MVTRSGEVPQGSGAGISSTIYTDRVSKLLEEGKLAGLGVRIVVENTRVSYPVSTITVSRRAKKFNTGDMEKLLEELSEHKGHPYLSASMELTTAPPRRFSLRRIHEKRVAFHKNPLATLDATSLVVPFYPVIRPFIIAGARIAKRDRAGMWKEFAKNLAWGAAEMVPYLGWGVTAAHAKVLTDNMAIDKIPDKIELQVSNKRGIIGRRRGGYQTIAEFRIPKVISKFA